MENWKVLWERIEKYKHLWERRRQIGLEAFKIIGLVKDIPRDVLKEEETEKNPEDDTYMRST